MRCQKLKGHEFSKLYCECKEQNKYLIMSQWKDQQSFQDFITSDAFSNVTNWGATEILVGQPSHQVY